MNALVSVHEGWGRDTEIPSGKVQDMGMVAEAVDARMQYPGSRQRVGDKWFLQESLSSSPFEAKLGEMGGMHALVRKLPSKCQPCFSSELWKPHVTEPQQH